MKRLFFTSIALSLLAVALFSGIAPASTHIDAEDLITLDVSPMASIVQVANLYEEESTFLSEVYEADYEFQLLGVNWQEVLPKSTAAKIEIRFRENGDWTNWQPIEVDQDGAYEGDGFWSYVITDNSDAFQYRANLSTLDRTVAPKLSDISFDYVTGGSDSVVLSVKKDLSRLIFKDDGDRIIDRDDWGANEDYRLAENHSNYDPNEEAATDIDDEILEEDPDMEIVKTVTKDDDGETLLWPLEYPKEVKKIIIHHTATTDDLDDPEEAIRAIYYYHSMTRGWGDIGYNYLIDKDGNVYEGRYGGDGVVGGHAAGYNTGSVGIALLGNYEDEPVPGEMVQSLSDLIYEKTQVHDIDPTGDVKFRGESMPNILGHRDVGATACPGDYLYPLLDGIADVVAASLDEDRHENSDDDFAYETASDLELVLLEPMDKTGVRIKIKNTGDETWTSSTRLEVDPNDDADDIVDVEEVSMEESSVRPGGTATFNFTVESGVLSGIAHFDVMPVFNGREESDNIMELGVYVEDPLIAFDVEDEDFEDDLSPKESTEVTIVLENESNFTWSNSGENKIVLKKSGSSHLTSESTLATLEEDEVKPGEEGTFTFDIKAPSGSGDYSLYYYPDLANGDAHVSASGRISVDVGSSSTRSSNDDKLAFRTSSDLSFMPGETRYVWIMIENLSDDAWKTRDEDSFDISFDVPSGMEVSEPRALLSTVNPGINLRVYFKVTAPDKDGEYVLEVQPRIDGKNLTSNYFDLDFVVDGAVNITTEDYENSIRIKLTPDDGAGSPIITSDARFSLFDDGDLLKNFAANSRVRVTEQEDGRYKITSGHYKWYVDGPVLMTAQEEDGIMQVLTMNQIAAWDNTINDNKFRGSIEVRKVDGETVLINELPLEDYVRGIAEETNTTPEEKLKTMSILARTYAYYYLTKDEKFPGMPYDLDDDPSTSQKYLGYGYELRHPNVVEAAEDTEGMVVTYDGEIVKTPYFSQSDGVATKSAQSVWGWTNAPYLVSVADEWCEADEFWGHGVGLSGCGAKAMAEAGYSFEEIIEYYYTGVEIDEIK